MGFFLKAFVARLALGCTGKVVDMYDENEKNKYRLQAGTKKEQGVGKCPYCGQNNTNGEAKYCAHCGKRFCV